MKKLSNFILENIEFSKISLNEAADSTVDSGVVEAYFNDIHKNLKSAIGNTIDIVNNIVNNLVKSLGKEYAGLIMNKGQFYDNFIEGILFKQFSNETRFIYKQGEENTNDKDFVCTKTNFSDKMMNKFGPKTFSIQVKTSKNGTTFTTNNSGVDEPSFFILISYKKDDFNISLDKAWFGYLMPEDWSTSSNNAKLNTNSFVKKSDKMLYEI